jgi:outer membrane protein assembly factor BamB
MFRGNPERNLSGAGKVPRRPKLLWRFRTKTKLEGKYEQRGSPTVTPGTAWQGLGWTGQPVLLGDRVYFGSSDSYTYCLEARTGKVVWHYPNHHVIKGSISIFNDHIYHGGRDNKIHCYDLNGQMVWETRTGNDMDSSPVVVNGRGFIGGEDRSIYCFDSETGQILWRVATDTSIESSPCVVGEHVIAASDKGVVYCLAAATGKLVWKAKTLGDTDASIVHWKGRLYAGCETGHSGQAGHVWCLDAATGKAIWHVRLSDGVWATPALDPEQGRVYVGSNNGYLYALRMQDGKLIWKRKLGNRIWSSPVVADGCVLLGVRDGRFWCLDKETGEPIWALDDGFDIDATPLVADGLIVIGSQNGWIYGIGEAGPDEQVNPHWFATKFPMARRLDRDPEGIPTIESPAPPPKTYTDTSARCRDNIYKPVYGPGAADRETTGGSLGRPSTRGRPARAARLPVGTGSRRPWGRRGFPRPPGPRSPRG